MLLTNESLTKLAPPFLAKVKDFSGNFNKFLDLETISYDEKVWMAKKILTNTQLITWGILCAESVLYIYEKEHPGQFACRNCINYLKTIKNFDNLSEKQKALIEEHSIAADAAAYAAVDAADAAAVDAAANAADAAANAADAADNAVDAVNAAANAVDAVNAAANAVNAAAYAAGNAAYAAGNAAYAAARKTQEDLNIKLLKTLTTSYRLKREKQ